MFTKYSLGSCIIVSLVFLVTFSGCISPAPPASATGNPPDIAPTATNEDAEEIVLNNFLALGDSYTIGESVQVEDRWPVQLVNRLRLNGVAISEPLMIAKTGWTTAELADAISASNLEKKYDLVSLSIGVNNQYRGYSLEEYRIEFNQLLENAIALAGGDPSRVIVVSIPDWGTTPFAEIDSRGPALITTEVTAFNSVNREETLSLGAIYVDIFPISQLAYQDAALIAGDGLHPSGAQYALWAEEILVKALEILK